MASALPIDLFLIGAAILILAALVALGLRHASIPSRGRWSLGVGVCVLLVGGTMQVFNSMLFGEPLFLSNNPELRKFIGEIVIMFGFGILAIGLVQVIVGMMIASELSHLEKKLAAATQHVQSTNGLLNSIMKSSLNGMLVLRATRNEAGDIEDFECVLSNRASEEILGRSFSDLKSSHFFASFPSLQQTRLMEKAIEVIETGMPVSCEQCIECKGKTGWYQVVAVKHGEGLAINFTEVTERKRIEDQLRYAALHDALTGLPNRAYLTDRLEQCLYRAKTSKNYHFAVLFLDFDRFKVINDSLGHEVGDELLKSIADRLRATLRAIDEVDGDQPRHIPTRLGGDEFVILLDQIHESANAVIVAERLQRDLATPHRIAGHEIVSTASIGIVTSDTDYERAEDMLRDADLAMYEAKANGKAQHAIFNQAMHLNAVTRLQFETELRDAVEREALLLEYQPIVCLESGNITGFEALIRWPHPTRGIILPNDFIGIAEEIGLIVPIGRWAIRKAATALRQWQNQYPERGQLTMSVNISKQELTHESLTSTVRDVLEETRIDPSTLHLEVTETTCMTDVDCIAQVLMQLKALGVQLSIDDFGKGHSTLSCLDQLPFDILKIDQSFVNSYRSKRDYAAILKSMVDLGRNLDMPVIVEGIETQDQLSFLQELGCNLGQGWLFSEAVSGATIETMLAAERKGRLAA